MTTSIRPDWLRHTVTQCQILAGHALPEHELPMCVTIDEFVRQVRAPKSRVENLLLRGMLLDVSLRWGQAHHVAYHHSEGSMVAACAFVPAATLAAAWRTSHGDTLGALTRWSVAYGRAFQQHHRRYAARELRRLFEARPASDVRLVAFAREYGISAKSLQTEFKALTGVSPRDYLNRRRVDMAIRLLEATNDKVEWIARSVGWSSRKNLNRALARHVTLTPAQVRGPRLAQASGLDSTA